ncbi:MAG: DUF4157 domain-containing protein [Chloroflexi bacterium]|nr:DUF4157 domain-containing protein [Chloroflexota bacterium]
MNDEQYKDEAVAEGSQAVGRLLRRVSGRALDDVRIHDSEQAGRLARRLGARAFTAGRDIYIRPDLVSPMTPEGSAVLAHELWHVAEHEGASASEMPLVHGPAPSNNSRAEGPGGGYPVQRAISTASTTSPGLSASEARAEAVEATARQDARRRERRPQEAQREALDPNEIAERVYNIMMQQLMIDAERGVRG